MKAVPDIPSATAIRGAGDAEKMLQPYENDHHRGSHGQCRQDGFREMLDNR